MHATTYRPDIVQTIPEVLFSQIKTTLGDASRILGTIEAYGVLSRNNRNLETPGNTDSTTVAVLADLLDRFSSVIKTPENEQIIDQANIAGYRDVISGKIKEISKIRETACRVITDAWNIEEIAPAIGFDPAVVVSNDMKADHSFTETSSETEANDDFSI